MIAFVVALGYLLGYQHSSGYEGSAMGTGNTSASWSLPVEKIVSPDDVRNILATAKKYSERDWTFFVIGANTGLRLSEVGHLMVDDVLDSNRLRVTRRKKKVLKPEIIDVAAPVHAIIREWAKQYEIGYLFPGNCAPCFIRHLNGTPEQFCIGGHSSLRDLQRRWKMVLAECGLNMNGRGIHSLRHAAITAFYASTRDLRAAQMFAGHSSSQMTERYAAVLDMKEKVNKVEVLM